MNNACRTGICGLRRRLPKLWGAIIALGLAAAVIGACNGGEGGGGSPTAQPTGQATTNAACEALASLSTYRFVSDATMESPEEIVGFSEGQTPVADLTREFEGHFYFDYNVDASVVTPDSYDALMTAGGYEPSHVIGVGGNYWIELEDGWMEATPQYGPPYKPLDVCNSIFPELNLDQAQGEKETVNDVPARHYAFLDTPSGQAIATIFGAESDMAILIRAMDVEVWLAEDGGWPVRMDIQGSGLYADGRELLIHVHVDVQDVNDKDIKIEPPV
jgi:ABC-type glycerol-3-phosphate transport system substrate-binding protein